MGGYTTVVVGTDGSDSSLRAVDRAGQLASGPDAKVIVATAYLDNPEDTRAADVLKDEGYKVTGAAPIYDILRDAAARARLPAPPTSRSGRSREHRSTPWWIWPMKWARTCSSSATSASTPSPAGCSDRCPPTSRASRRPTS